MSKSLETLGRSLPDRFPFYHLGEIAVSESQFTDSSQIETEGRSAIGIRIYGDFPAMLLVLVDEGLDLSIYSEVANILASRLSTQLSASQEMDILISAPTPLSASRLKDLIRPNQAVLGKRYMHCVSGGSAGVTLGVDAILVPDSPTGEIRA
jgi:hypothetical protein